MAQKSLLLLYLFVFLSNLDYAVSFFVFIEYNIDSYICEPIFVVVFYKILALRRYFMDINGVDFGNKYINMEYGINEVLILLAKHLKLTQKDLVESTGIDKSKMSRFFNKKEIPNKNHLQKLAKPLKVSKETLWIISGDMLPPNMESKIIDELKSLKKILAQLNKNEFKEELNIDIKLTANEKRFIKEYIEFIKFKRNNSR